MAMTKCKECGNEVSTKADSCPHCGAKLKREGIGAGSGCLVILLLFAGVWFHAVTSRYGKTHGLVGPVPGECAKCRDSPVISSLDDRVYQTDLGADLCYAA